MQDQLEIVDINILSLALYSQADWYQIFIKKILIFKLVNTLGNIKSLFSLFIVIHLLKNTQNFYDHLLQCTETKMCFNPIHGKPLSTDITELIPSTRKNHTDCRKGPWRSEGRNLNHNTPEYIARQFLLYVCQNWTIADYL